MKTNTWAISLVLMTIFTISFCLVGSCENETPSTAKLPKDTSRSVFITPTGKRYHYSATCAGKNATLTTKNKAIDLLLAPCKKCT